MVGMVVFAVKMKRRDNNQNQNGGRKGGQWYRSPPGETSGTSEKDFILVV